MKSLLHFAFSVSFLTVLILLFIEWKIPGFVSYVFPFYILIVGLFVLGLFALQTPLESNPQNPKPIILLSVLAGLALMGVIWTSGDTFSFMRIPLALLALIFPVLFTRLLAKE